MNTPEDLDLILRRFEEPDEVREMPLGRFEIITVALRNYWRLLATTGDLRRRVQPRISLKVICTTSAW